MFPVRAPKHIRRVSFASKLFPKINSPFGLGSSKQTGSDTVSTNVQSELFATGRSKNRDLLTFFGFIAETGCGSNAPFAQLPTFRRSLAKLVELVETELQLLGAQEVLLPTLVPQNLWEQSGRLDRQTNVKDNVYELEDNEGVKLMLGPTFEETITKVIANADPINEHDLPLMLYQTSPKFRMELNPRFGLIRTREFLMNDLYTFDANLDLAINTYEAVTEVYQRIFKLLGLNCERTESPTGAIGGKFSHEYQLHVSSGEDYIILCDDCHKMHNIELNLKSRTADLCVYCGSTKIRKIQGLELGHTFLLSKTYSEPLGAVYLRHDGTRHENLEMGCYGIGLTRVIAAGIDCLSVSTNTKGPLNAPQIRWPRNIEPFKVGIVAPAKRSKQYHAGSSAFIQKLVERTLDGTDNTDFLIEDRDKESLVKRLVKLQYLGIPHIIVIGQRFLDEIPTLEVLTLDEERTNYVQSWLSEDQVLDYLMRLG